MKNLKVIFTQFLLVVCCFAISAAPLNTKKKIKSRFPGIWELAYIGDADGQEFPARPGQLKFFEANGAYRFLFVSDNATFVTQQGSFKIISDKVYSEDIEFSTNPNLRNVSSKVNYVFTNEDTLVLSGSVNGVAFHEKWIRVKMPSL